MNYFKDKVIWITGATSGIGEALALELARREARLILSARREVELRRVAALTQLPELDIFILPFDLKNTSNASGWAAQVMNKFGRIDVLINNGGVSQRSDAIDTDEKTERELMEINYFSYVNLTKAVLPYMLRQKSGQIVNISSISGKFGFYKRSSYSAAKHALHGYFESLRLETEERGIKILMVCPGKIKTSVSLNAVVAGGVKNNVMEKSHEEAMSARDCAVKIIDAMPQHREEIYIGGKEIWMIYFRRFFPRIFRKLLRSQKNF